MEYIGREIWLDLCQWGAFVTVFCGRGYFFLQNTHHELICVKEILHYVFFYCWILSFYFTDIVDCS
jgi:hypothetical protein